VLAVEGLGKRFGPVSVFRGLEFSVGLGDGLLVLGPNGSGKSTLLRILGGLLAPTEGSVRWEGDPRTSLGYSALDLAVYPHLTVQEHFLLAGRLRGCDPRADDLTEGFGLAGHKEHFASKLSSGLRSRLKLALSVQSRPSLLLLDEPGVGLDEAGLSLLDRVCAEQRERGALVVATNDPKERRLGSHELRLGE